MYDSPILSQHFIPLILIQLISFDFKKGNQLLLKTKQMLHTKNYAIAPYIHVDVSDNVSPGADDVDGNEIRLYKFFLNFESVHFALIL